MITKNEIKKLYKESDKRIIMFLSNVVTAMGGVEDDSKAILDMLESQLNLYFLAKDDVKKNGINITTKPSGNTVKNPAVSVLQQCYSRIIDLLKECGVTKMSKAKLNRIGGTGDEDAQTLLEALTA